MTTPEKAKGSEFERAVVRYLRQRGFSKAERRYGAGAQADKGDINGLANVTCEVKNLSRITLSSIMDETIKEMATAKNDLGVAIVKRRGRGAGQSYAVMTLENWVTLYSESGFCP